MPSQNKKGKQTLTIRRILDTAAEVFAEVGFAGARMDEIANRAGVNKATIYYHIGDKKTLYARVLHELFASTGDQLDRVLQQAESPEEKIAHYIQQIAQALDQNPHKAIMMLREIADRGEFLPDIVMQDLAAIIGKLMDFLSEGEKQGRFIAANPISVHLMVIGAMVLYKAGTPMREKIIQSSESIGNTNGSLSGFFADEIERLVLRALKSDPDPILNIR
jgi:AcrR family transcriptional regulator